MVLMIWPPVSGVIGYIGQMNRLEVVLEVEGEVVVEEQALGEGVVPLVALPEGEEVEMEVEGQRGRSRSCRWRSRSCGREHGG